MYLCTWAQITSLWCSLGRPMSELAGWSKWLEAWRFQSPALPCVPFRFMLVVEAVTALLPVTGAMCAAPLSPPLCTQTSWNHKWKESHPSVSCFSHGVSSPKQKSNEYKNLSLSFLPFPFLFSANSWFQLCLAMCIVYFSLVLFVLCFCNWNPTFVSRLT